MVTSLKWEKFLAQLVHVVLAGVLDYNFHSRYSIESRLLQNYAISLGFFLSQFSFAVAHQGICCGIYSMLFFFLFFPFFPTYFLVSWWWVVVFVSIKIIEEDNFSVENKLGRGGFGEVYRVEKHYDMKCIIQFLGVELNNHSSTCI